MISKRLRQTFASVASAGALVSFTNPPARAASLPPVKMAVAYKQDPACPHPPASANTRPGRYSPRQVQEQLQKLGFNLGPSGVDGAVAGATIAATKEAQWFYGLKMTGQPDPLTRAMLQRRLEAAEEHAQIYNTTTSIAAAVARAAELTCTPLEELVARGLMEARLSMSKGRWLALLKTFGSTLHMDSLSSFIEISPALTQEHSVYLNVPFESVEWFIFGLKENPRINRVLQAADKDNSAASYVFRQALTGEALGIDAGTAYSETTLRLQQSLITFGLSPGSQGTDGLLGEQTLRSAYEALWFFGLNGNTDALSVLEQKAKIAIEDSVRFRVPPPVAASIRRASETSGIAMSYFLEMGKTESNHDKDAKNSDSSATGWPQFTDDTWLSMVDIHGEQIGLGGFADMMHVEKSAGGADVSVIDNPFPGLEDLILSFRKNPRVSALMVAEFTRINDEVLRARLRIKPENTELYIAHFLGCGDAVTFLRQDAAAPYTLGAEVFPAAARSNPEIFFSGKGEDKAPRTIREIRSVLQRRLYTPRFHQQPAAAPKKLAKKR